MIGEQRGQTTIDFAIGVSLFLLVVIFVFLFVPDLFEPFNSGTQEETVAVNRVADELAQRQLGTASQPFVANATCTALFFNESAAPNCNFESGSLRDQMNIDARQQINVTLTRLNGTNVSDSSDVLCWDDSRDTLTGADNSNCTPGSGDVVLQRGEPLPLGSTSSVSARRVITVDGRAVGLTVVMW